mmetsp:Transcript_6849/g.15789  ORF Transcript_6849/g.15789 Transcript_6849/m.15789 type:complete len:206 (-) Transcript_6849:35-652(-)
MGLQQQGPCKRCHRQNRHLLGGRVHGGQTEGIRVQMVILVNQLIELWMVQGAMQHIVHEVLNHQAHKQMPKRHGQGGHVLHGSRHAKVSQDRREQERKRKDSKGVGPEKLGNASPIVTVFGVARFLNLVRGTQVEVVNDPEEPAADNIAGYDKNEEDPRKQGPLRKSGSQGTPPEMAEPGLEKNRIDSFHFHDVLACFCAHLQGC